MMQDTGTAARIHLPIEGHTKWPFVMRVVAFGSVVTVLMLAIIFTLFLAPDATEPPSMTIITGLVFLMMVELAVLRLVIIPFNGDYGRFRFTDTKVDLFPLSRTGFTVLPEPVSVVMTAYKGVALRVGNGRHGMYYDVFLNHQKRSHTIHIRSFETKEQAETFARALADALGLRFIPQQ